MRMIGKKIIGPVREFTESGKNMIPKAGWKGIMNGSCKSAVSNYIFGLTLFF